MNLQFAEAIITFSDAVDSAGVQSTLEGMGSKYGPGLPGPIHWDGLGYLLNIHVPAPTLGFPRLHLVILCHIQVGEPQSPLAVISKLAGIPSCFHQSVI